MTYEESPVKILDSQVRKLRNRNLQFVKVQWSHHAEREATWELESDIRTHYPSLFQNHTISLED